jgi:hypothetical protein
MSRIAARALVLAGCLCFPSGALAAIRSLSQGPGILLSPNPITSMGAISADFTSVQARVTGTPCALGQAITEIAQSGTATCAPVVTKVSAGTGLSEGQSTGDVTLNLDDPLSLTGSSSHAILEGLNTSAGDGVHGQTADAGFSGVFGQNAGSGKGEFGASGSGHGVEGIGGSAGVYGTTRLGPATVATASRVRAVRLASGAPAPRSGWTVTRPTPPAPG